jgi:hypothetical protein
MFASATNVYITPDGSSQGACTTNPQTPAWFNNAANWGNGTSQIGPGTTVLLCGTVTSPLTFQGSGTSSNPITLTFDTGAVISATCGGNGCLAATNQSYVIVDGGTTCGWVNQVQVPCNGTVESSVAEPPGSSFGIEASGCLNCEFRNLNIGPIYTVTSGGTQPAGDVRGIQALPSTGTGTWKVHNNIIHDTSSSIVYVPNGSNDSGLQAYNNVTYNINSSVDMSNNNNGTFTGASIHDNHFGSTQNWDTNGCDNHHNSLHLFSYTQTATGVYYYNNRVDGNWGNCPTSELFMEGSGSLINSVYVFNNLFLATYIQENNGIVNITANNLQFYNNTIIGASQSGDNCLFLSTISGNGSIYAENNVISGCVGQLLASNTAMNQFTKIDYNTYGGTSGSTPWAVSCGETGCTYFGFSGWKPACSCDTHSTFGASNTYVGVNSDGNLQSGSPAVGAGTNLANLGIAGLGSDMTGVQRPGGVLPWDEGPLNFSSVAPPAPPTGLSVVVQ